MYTANPLTVNKYFGVGDAESQVIALQKTKTHFHQQTLPLRCGTDDTVEEALNQLEAQLDTILVRCVEQEYYMRLLPEVYNEVMQPAIDKFCRAIDLAQR